MVQEVRRIMFTQDELFAAFEYHRQMTPDFLPVGKMITCSLTEDGSVRVTMQMPESEPVAKTEFIFKSVEAVKPLIRFCLKNNIMLPREGQKTLHVKDDQASLYVVLSTHIDVSAYLPDSHAASRHMVMPADILKEEKTAVG